MSRAFIAPLRRVDRGLVALLGAAKRGLTPVCTVGVRPLLAVPLRRPPRPAPAELAHQLDSFNLHQRGGSIARGATGVARQSSSKPRPCRTAQGASSEWATRPRPTRRLGLIRFVDVRGCIGSPKRPVPVATNCSQVQAPAPCARTENRFRSGPAKARKSFFGRRGQTTI
jgi:hypothetical protein